MTYYLTCAPHYNMAYHLPPDILILDLWLSHSQESCRVILYYIQWLESCAYYPVLYIQWPESIVFMYSWIPDHVLILLFLWIANYILNYNKTTCTRFGGNWWALINHVFGGLIESRVATYLRDHLAATKDSVGCAGTPTPVYSCRVYHKPLGLFLWERWHPISIQAYNKSRYLAVRSGSAPDTPWSLSRACTWHILGMVRRPPSVSNNLLFSLYAEICGMGHITTYTNQTSLNNLIITCPW